MVVWNTFIDISYSAVNKPIVTNRRRNDPNYHGFGTAYNCSKKERIVGRCIIPIPVVRGKWLEFSALVVDGDVPFIMGKDTLREFDAQEAH